MSIFASENRNSSVDDLNFIFMRTLKTYRIFFKTTDHLTGRKKPVSFTLFGYSLKSIMSHLRNQGYTISRDYYYYVTKSVIKK